MPNSSLSQLLFGPGDDLPGVPLPADGSRFGRPPPPQLGLSTYTPFQVPLHALAAGDDGSFLYNWVEALAWSPGGSDPSIYDIFVPFQTTYSVNNSNAAKNTIANFSRGGLHILRLLINRPALADSLTYFCGVTILGFSHSTMLPEKPADKIARYESLMRDRGVSF